MRLLLILLGLLGVLLCEPGSECRDDADCDEACVCEEGICSDGFT